MQVLTLKFNSQTCPVYIGKNIFANKSLLTKHIRGQQVLIVTQKNIARFYLSSLEKVLSKYQCDIIYLNEGEQYKTLQEWQKIIDVLITQKHERHTTLIALGGGMVGDMTGFAAACYQRGVHYIQIPTTLIGQVDSAIGGKTGINHALGKNMLGAFYQPQCVIADIETLMSLPEREFRSGLAEVIKYGIIWDEKFFKWIEENILFILNKNADALLEMIAQSIAIKADIVMQDERDHDVRQLLNFGHTFGHALETALSYQTILHGEAVAIGMLMAVTLSMSAGWIAPAELHRIQKLLQRCQLIPTFHFPSAKEMIALMKQDKKVRDQGLNLILLEGMGEAVVVKDVDEENIRAVIELVFSWYADSFAENEL